MKLSVELRWYYLHMYVHICVYTYIHIYTYISFTNFTEVILKKFHFIIFIHKILDNVVFPSYQIVFNVISGS